MHNTFYIKILEAESQQPGYKVNDVHTYSQEPVAETLLRDMAIHMFGDPSSTISGCCDKYGNATRGQYYAGYQDRVANAALKFTRSKDQTHIYSKLLPSVLPAFIINRYSLYHRPNFTYDDLIHHQQVKVFYSHKRHKFFVNLPDHFFEGVTADKIEGPERYSGGRFCYDTQTELEQHYPNDLEAFAKTYLRFFIHHQQGQPVIMVFSSRAKPHVGYHDNRRIQEDIEYETSTFSCGLSAARGMLYGNIFYQRKANGEIDTEHGMQLTAYDDSGRYKLYGTDYEKQPIKHCIPDTEQDWKALVAIFEAFHKAQHALDQLLVGSHDRAAVLGRSLNPEALLDTLRTHRLLSSDTG